MIKINTLNKDECCGCGACKEICPQNAIEFVVDKEGFWYPKVQKDKCTNCGLCDNVCPFKNKYESEIEEKNAYAMYINDFDTRIKSSSGGIFSVIANTVLSDGGVIFGAAFTEDFEVEHIGIDNKSELYKLRGSKYVQSDTKKTFLEVKKILEDGKKVLYTGTACQIAGLKKYLRKSYDNLLTVDVLCHGVPSPKVWKKYVAEVGCNDKITAVNFRNKESGWKNFSVCIGFEKEKRIFENYEKNDYMRLFLGNLSLRPSCYNCKYKELDRPSDITIGDYWGIEEQHPELDDDKGISIVIVHTKAGRKVLEEINDKITKKEVNCEDALPLYSDSRRSVGIPDKRSAFFRRLDRSSIDRLTELLRPLKHLKIRGKIRRTKNKIRKVLKKIVR